MAKMPAMLIVLMVLTIFGCVTNREAREPDEKSGSGESSVESPKNSSDAGVNTASGIQPDLISAASQGDTNLVTTLIDVGKDPNERNNEGLTPLMAAAKNGHKETVLVLLSQGANISAKDNGSHTASMHAVANGHRDVAEMIEDFVSEKKRPGNENYIMSSPKVKKEKRSD